VIHIHHLLQYFFSDPGSPSREYDYESRYHREERDREFSRGFEADAKRDRDRYPRDKNRYDRDRYRDRDHDSHNLEMIRDRRDESLREHGQRRERPNDHSRRDRLQNLPVVLFFSRLNPIYYN